MSFVDVKNLTVTYLGRATPSLTIDRLQLRRGESVLVVGKSGSGKSTLVNVINGVIPHMISAKVEGDISVMGFDPRVTPIYEMSKKVGTLLQDPESQVFHHLVKDEVAFGPENYALPRTEILERIEEASRITGIYDLLERETSTLSGGELQRTVLASVLALRPEALIMDEPTSSIDPQGTAEILGLIRSLREKGTSMIIVEHKVEMILQFVDRIILVDQGRIALDLPKEEIRHHAHTLHKAGVEVPYDLVGRPSPIPRKTVGETLLRAKVNVRTKEGRTIVNTEIDLRKGEVVALMGRNGSGKTTLLKAIMGLLDRLESRTEVFVDGVDLSKKPYWIRGKYIAYLPQNFDVMFVKRTVEDEVKFSSKDPDYYLKAFSLAHLRKEDPLTLSFGQRRRVAMASLLGKGQKIAMLDEPTSGQDWHHREVLGREINDLKERGISFLVVTHDSRFVEMFCDRVILMDQGKITARGTPEQVLHLTR